MTPKGSASEVSRRHRSSSLFSCFKGSRVLDSDDAESPVSRSCSGRKASLLSWSKFQAKKKKKMAPVDASSSLEKPSAQKTSSKKARKNKTKPRCKLQHQQTLQGEPLHQVAAQYNTCAQPSPLFCVRDPARTATSTVHPGFPGALNPNGAPSHMPSKKCANATGQLDPGAVMPVLTLTLVATVFFGRACAIFCLSAWFYLLPRVRPAAAAVIVGDTVAKKDEIDMNSEEHKKRVVLENLEVYKKRVVLEGLLERKNSKQFGSFRASMRTNTGK